MELIKLIKMLFTPVKEDVSFIQMKHFPFNGYKYMMWCGGIIYKDKEDINISQKELNHELIHLCQAKIKGSWIKFYCSYFVEWLNGTPFLGYKSAYYTVPYEMEAYANEDNFDYTHEYDGKNLVRYIIANRKKTFWDNPNWKQYLKTL